MKKACINTKIPATKALCQANGAFKLIHLKSHCAKGDIDCFVASENPTKPAKRMPMPNSTKLIKANKVFDLNSCNKTQKLTLTKVNNLSLMVDATKVDAAVCLASEGMIAIAKLVFFIKIFSSAFPW